MKEIWLAVEESIAWVRAQEVSATAHSHTVKRCDNSELVHLSKAKFDALQTTSTLATDDVADDLAMMSDVSDATSLDTMRRRYARDDIYTAIGAVTISINPFKNVSGCTSEAIARCAKEGEAAPPHVVRTATMAFHGLTNASPDERLAQSILISGETGAGKTEACKLCLLALAELSESSGVATEACLESAVLLEAFGNAKTVYNDNSSRFCPSFGARASGRGTGQRAEAPDACNLASDACGGRRRLRAIRRRPEESQGSC